MTATSTYSNGDKAPVKAEVDAKQGTDKPRNMPVVLAVSTVGAVLALMAVWMFFI